MDSGVDKTPKVTRRTHLHVFTPKELHSIFLFLTHTLQTPNTPHGPFSEALAKTRPRPNLVIDQGDQESYGNTSTSIIQPSDIGMVRTNVQGSMNPGDTPMVTEPYLIAYDR